MFYPHLKRIFDLGAAGFGLLLLAPLGLLLALLVKLSDGGPVLYGQIRIGQFGRPFRIWKFRSMVVNADKIGMAITKDRDPRITRIGRLLRKSKLDELPQLWNVLTGQMSFVGPRPEVARYVELYTPEQREILHYKPGITDLATLLFRNEEALLSGAKDVEEFYLKYCLPRKIELNRHYAERAGLIQDLWIILQTLCPYWMGVLVIYTLALTASFWLSYQLRSDFHMTPGDYGQFWRRWPLIVLPPLILLFWRGQMRGLLSYFSIPEIRQTATALVAALFVQVGLCYLILGEMAPTKSLFLINVILSFFTLCVVRMAFRLFRERSTTSAPRLVNSICRVAIIGTGDLATNLALDFARRPHPVRRVVAFFDDNPHTWQKRPHDIPVFGMPECLLNPEWLNKIDEVIVALPAGNSSRQSQIVDMVKGLPLKVTMVSDWPTHQTVEAV